MTAAHAAAIYQVANTPSVEAFRSAAYSGAMHRLALFAKDVTAPILLLGESGTGKTTIARRIHEMSPRAKGPFQHVVLSAMDDGISGSELFGHVVGAFTDARRPRAGHFSAASGGTLFLDEIGKASRVVQAKLLHALEYGTIRPVGSDRELAVSVRIVAASNVDLGFESDEGRFLPDLYARLAAFQVRLPPLRERRADIRVLVAQSVYRHFAACGYDVPPKLDDDLILALERATWTQNLRELDSTVHRLLLEADGAMQIGVSCYWPAAGGATDATDAKESSKRDRAKDAIRRAGGVTRAARMLGVDRKTVRRWRDQEA